MIVKTGIENFPELTDAFGFPLEGPASGQITTGTPRSIKSDDYLVSSPILEDGGHQIGRLPRDISVDVLRAIGGPESPMKAIRAKCIDCSGGNPTEARKCVAFGCTLWPFRMGRNPFWGKADNADDGEAA
jgi:hypothetical protein